MEEIRLNTNQKILKDKAFKLYLKKEYEESLTLIEECLEISPCAECFTIKAYIYKSLKNFTEAEKNYTLAIESDLNDASSYHLRGNFFFRRSNFYDAIDDYSYVINNSNLEYREIVIDSVLFERALVYCCIGEFDKAMEDYKKTNINVRFMYILPIAGKVNKEILLEHIVQRKRFELRVIK